MSNDYAQLSIYSTPEDIICIAKKAIEKAAKYEVSEAPGIKDTTPFVINLCSSLLGYKGAELNAETTDKLNFTTWVLVFVTIVLVIVSVVQLMGFFCK